MLDQPVEELCVRERRLHLVEPRGQKQRGGDKRAGGEDRAADMGELQAAAQREHVFSVERELRHLELAARLKPLRVRRARKLERRVSEAAQEPRARLLAAGGEIDAEALKARRCPGRRPFAKIAEI